MDKSFCKLMKIAVAVSAFFGVMLGLLTAKADGYSSTFSRLMYFTAQSNLWLGVLYVFLAVFSCSKRKSKGAGMQRLYLLRFIAIVSISMTCLVFCALLAPFSNDASYRPWAIPNVWTHVVTPMLALVDFFTDRQPIVHKRILWLCMVPFLVYFAAVSMLGIWQVDFGRGQPFPYFFVNYFSPVGLFGFSNTLPYVMGSVYWYLLFGLIATLLALLYRSVNKKLDKSHKK